MPIRGDALKVKNSMQEQYGDDWEKVFYATANKQGRNPDTWEKIDESEAIKQVLLGTLASKLLTEATTPSRVVQSACHRIIAEAIENLTEDQKQEFSAMSLLLEEAYHHNLQQIKAAQELVSEPGIQKWGKRKFGKDWMGSVEAEKIRNHQAELIIRNVSTAAKEKARTAIDAAEGATQEIGKDGKRQKTPMVYDVPSAERVREHIKRIFRDDLMGKGDL